MEKKRQIINKASCGVAQQKTVLQEISSGRAFQLKTSYGISKIKLFKAMEKKCLKADAVGFVGGVVGGVISGHAAGGTMGAIIGSGSAVITQIALK